ncbi:MAG TPA: LLM class flavin-dependent oxidoreductase [Stellaceae bacterium]|nr:LLM class flavin-dependent oxidoreductase [Stellaceae bacterium]
MSDERAATNPLFNDNRLKLGTFATNVDGAASISTIEGRFEAKWPNVVRMADIADRAGFEAIVPVARWRGFGGKTDFNGASFETYTWAAGLAAITKTPAIFSTSHVPTIHPVVAAKQATTIDHISGGRFGLNIVCGWFKPELRMFGAPIMEHDTAYEYAAEWVEVLKLLWTREDEFDYEGRYFKVEKGYHRPKPIQKPFPLLMNAGFSPMAREFVLKYCDVAFTGFQGAGTDAVKKQLAAYRDRAHKEYGRSLSIWAGAAVIIGDTEAEAKARYEEAVNEKGDWEAVDSVFRIMGMVGRHQGKSEAELLALKRLYIGGYGADPMIGTAEMIADKLEQKSKAGIDGVLVTCPAYESDLRRFVREVVPLLEQKGLRKPARQSTEP